MSVAPCDPRPKVGKHPPQDIGVRADPAIDVRSRGCFLRRIRPSRSLGSRLALIGLQSTPSKIFKQLVIYLLPVITLI